MDDLLKEAVNTVVAVAIAIALIWLCAAASGYHWE